MTPATPLRVCAGHETFFYSFADEAEFTAKAIEAGLIPDPLQALADADAELGLEDSV